MARIVVRAGEFNFPIDLPPFTDENGKILDISSFSSRLLDVRPTDYGTLVLTNKAVVFKTDGIDGLLTWIKCDHNVSVVEANRCAASFNPENLQTFCVPSDDTFS